MEKIKILIAEDNSNYRFLYEKVFGAESFSEPIEFKIVRDGMAAVEAYNEWQPDVLLLDIMMPVMTGYLALKEVRNLEKENGRNTTVIMASSLTDKSDIQDCAKVGIQGYIIKPFDDIDLVEKIREYHKAHLASKKQN